MAKTKKEPSPRSQCWCKEKDSYPHPKHPTPRKLKRTAFDSIIGDLESLRDGENDGLGKVLGSAIAALRRADRIQAALADLIAAHDEVPSMLTAAEWDAARKVLEKSGTASPKALVVASMDSESKEWIAVGRTEEEARAGLVKRWNEIVPALGGETWDKANGGHGGDAGDYYGVRIQHVVLGKGYCDSEDEKGL
jgi:hypothetical protein